MSQGMLLPHFTVNMALCIISSWGGLEETRGMYSPTISSLWGEVSVAFTASWSSGMGLWKIGPEAHRLSMFVF